MNIMSIHCSHHGAVSVSSGGKLIVHSEISRLNKFKYLPQPDSNLIKKIDSLGLEFDIILFTMTEDNCFNYYDDHLLKRLHLKPNGKIMKNNNHHLFHAGSAKNFKKEFDNYFVWDGNGAVVEVNNYSGTETLSLWDGKLDLQKRFLVTNNFVDTDDGINYLSFKNLGIGEAYTTLTRELKLYKDDIFSEGKAMALSSFGKYDHELHKKIYNEDGTFNLNNIHIYELKNEVGERTKFTNYKKYNTNKENIEAQNFAHTYQRGVENLGLKFVKDLKINGSICFTGGVTQNVLLNTFLSKNLDQEIEFDPLCNDQGISLGSLNCFLDYKLQREDGVYLGFKPDYEDLYIFKKLFKIYDADISDVGKIVQENPLALFQGRSEQGQRGLGNRSLLMNATHADCVNKINKVKKREWYRPFACSILSEELENYFIVDNNRNPEFMMHVFNAKYSKSKELKNVLAKDGTCRLQSVKKTRNYYFHKLLDYCNTTFKFPFLLNTSLNLPGMPIVEDLHDLKEMMLKSDLEYAWLPDIGKLIKKIN